MLNKTLVAVIYRVDLLKDTIAALQHVGGILQTASFLKLETSAAELLSVLLCMTHTDCIYFQLFILFTRMCMRTFVNVFICTFQSGCTC